MQAAKSALADMTEWSKVSTEYKAHLEFLSEPAAHGKAVYAKLFGELDGAIIDGKLAQTKALLGELGEWKPILTELAQQEAFVTKSAPYLELLGKFQEAVEAGDLGAAQSRMADVLAKREELVKKAAKRKGGKVFWGQYPESRKNAAVWDTEEAALKAGRQHGELADKTLFDSASKSWRDSIVREKRTKELIAQYESGILSKAEFEAALKKENLVAYSYEEAGRTRYVTQREMMYDYTKHYCDVNEPLENRKYYNPQKVDKFTAKVNAMTDYLDTCSTPVDMWFQRGDNDMSAIFGRLEFAGVKVAEEVKDIVNYLSSNISDEVIEKLQSLVGTTMQEGGFMSMGSGKRKGFNESMNRRVILNIFAPKGTKAMYSEHFSHFGRHVKSASWDGISRSNNFSQEFETIAQRGTQMRITKIQKGRYYDDDIIYIDVEIVGQEVRDLSYVKIDNIGY